jgi:hypothetical protein
MPDEWRKGTWATSGVVVAVGLSGEGLNWATVTPTRPLWPLWLFFGFAAFGIFVFVVAMARPHWLPGQKIAAKEAQDRKEKWHSDQLQLDHKRAEAQRFRDFFNRPRTDYDQREHTQAMERLSDEMQRARGDEPRQRGFDSPSSSSDNST